MTEKTNDPFHKITVLEPATMSHGELKFAVQISTELKRHFEHDSYGSSYARWSVNKLVEETVKGLIESPEFVKFKDQIREEAIEIMADETFRKDMARQVAERTLRMSMRF